MTLLFDLHANFAYSTVATAPSPASSGTSLTVQSGDGAKFPGVSFNAVVWPVGANPLTTNAEIVRVTNISSDTFTITRTQEGTSARSILVGDQIGAVISKKTFTDIENAPLYFGGRLGLDSNYVPTSDLTAQTTLNWNPGGPFGDRLAVFDGTSTWTKFSSGQLTLKATDSSQTGGSITGTSVTGLTSTAQLVPGMTLTASTGTGTLAAGTTISSITSSTALTVNNAASVNGTLTNLTFKLAASTVYDVILVNDGGTLRLLWGPAWTNTTARASALTTQNGINVNSGSWTTGWTNGGASVATLTGLYLGTVYVGTAGQLNDSALLRNIWSNFNRKARDLYLSLSASWTYSSTTWRQMNGSASNQIEGTIGLVEDEVELTLAMWMSGSSATGGGIIGIGQNWSSGNPTRLYAGPVQPSGGGITVAGESTVPLKIYPGLGHNIWMPLEATTGGVTVTFQGNVANTLQSGVIGVLLG